ncbi:MAG TPA: polysaccharide biosynthesis/export family protein [Pyrinomonadaceae bacterium]|nr:polysaccharide biosynthesis/export family protein [Pyrinomonadaceae bacterium]
MRMNAVLKAMVLAVVLTVSLPAFAQEQQPQQGEKQQGAQPSPTQTTGSATPPAASSAAQTTKPASPSAIPAELQTGRRESLSEEEAAIVPYYNNFLKEYRLGPEDVISVDVFNQPRYSKGNITVPPDGRISFPLIAEGVRVVGKTTQQVQEEIQKRLDEFIIDPQVTVYLDKAMSARYSVMGDVGRPGVMVMTRRVSLLEALAEAGGILNTGDKKKVVILRRKADGTLGPIIVNVSAIEKGKAKEMTYLAAGDQVIVPGNRLKSIQQLLSFTSILSFGRIFGLPF